MKKSYLLSLLVALPVVGSALSPLKLEIIDREDNVHEMKINNRGQIALTRGNFVSEIGTLQTGFTTFSAVPGYGPLSSRITDLNDNGQVTGVTYYNNGIQNIRAAFRAGIGEETKYLANLPHQENYGAGHKLNNHGTVVGTGLFAGFLPIGDSRESGILTYWSDANALTPMLHPNFTREGFNKINDEGYISDGSRLGKIGQTSFTTMNGIYGQGGILKITNSPFVVGGTREAVSGRSSVEVWDFAGNRLWSKTFQQYESNGPIDATDDAKSVLITAALTTFENEPAIWSPLTGTVTGVGTMLNSQAIAEGWHLTYMSDINNAGQMVGYATKNGTSYAVLLSPVPEPTTMFVLGAGILGILRKRKPAPRR